VAGGAPALSRAGLGSGRLVFRNRGAPNTRTRRRAAKERPRP
jgi:hypothetical protein